MLMWILFKKEVYSVHEIFTYVMRWKVGGRGVVNHMRGHWNEMNVSGEGRRKEWGGRKRGRRRRK